MGPVPGFAPRRRRPVGERNVGRLITGSRRPHASVGGTQGTDANSTPSSRSASASSGEVSP